MTTSSKSKSNFAKAPKAVRKNWLADKIQAGYKAAARKKAIASYYKDQAKKKAIASYYGKKRGLERWAERKAAQAEAAAA